MQILCDWCGCDVSSPGFVCDKHICPLLDPFEPTEAVAQPGAAEQKTDDEPQPSASHE